MSFDPRDMATQGLFPGRVTTQLVANLGHFFLEVIIEKLPRGGPGTAGGAVNTAGRREKDKYKVTMRVMYKTRVWEYERVVSHITASVTAKLIGKPLPEDPDVTVYSVIEKENEDPTIEVYKK